MSDRWIIRVGGKEYGPVDFDTLIDWKNEGRLLPENQARREEEEQWSTADRIPGLFRSPVEASPQSETSEQSRALSGKIFTQTFRIYVKGFFRFLGLSALVIVPSLCGQLMEAFAERILNTDTIFVGLISSAFGFCMMTLVLVLWPVYLAGVQILTAELAAGRQIGLAAVLSRAAKFWPRIAALCLVVYGIFFLLLVFAFGIALVAVGGGQSLFLIFFVLTLLLVQVWLFARWFINVLFWQQAAVLDNADVSEALRQSKELAHSGGHLPWHSRPLWRGAFIASIWFAFVLVLEVLVSWPTLRHSFQLLMTTPDPQALVDAIKADSASHGLSFPHLLAALIQSVLRPILGIAFVLLYLDARTDLSENELAPPDAAP
jgi:hypothetical protein